MVCQPSGRGSDSRLVHRTACLSCRFVVCAVPVWPRWRAIGRPRADRRPVAIQACLISAWQGTPTRHQRSRTRRHSTTRAHSTRRHHRHRTTIYLRTQLHLTAPRSLAITRRLISHIQLECSNVSTSTQYLPAANSHAMSRSPVLLLCTFACLLTLSSFVTASSIVQSQRASNAAGKTFSLLDAPPLGHRDAPADQQQVGAPQDKGYYDSQGYYHSDNSGSSVVFLAVFIPLGVCCAICVCAAVARRRHMMMKNQGDVVIVPPGGQPQYDGYGNPVGYTTGPFGSSYATSQPQPPAYNNANIPYAQRAVPPSYAAPAYGDAPVGAPVLQPVSAAGNGYPGAGTYAQSEFAGEGRTVANPPRY